MPLQEAHLRVQVADEDKHSLFFSCSSIYWNQNKKTWLIPTYTSGKVCITSQESFRDPRVTTRPSRAKHSAKQQFPVSCKIIMTLLVILPTGVPQKTTDAVSENNYSFRQLLTLPLSLYHHSLLLHLPSTQATAASRKLFPTNCIAEPSSPIFPLPVAEIAWPHPLCHITPNLNFHCTDEELWLISGVTFAWLCCISRGTRSQLYPVLFWPLTGGREVSNSNPVKLLFLLTCLSFCHNCYKNVYALNHFLKHQKVQPKIEHSNCCHLTNCSFFVCFWSLSSIPLSLLYEDAVLTRFFGDKIYACNGKERKCIQTFGLVQIQNYHTLTYYRGAQHFSLNEKEFL